MLTLLGTVGVAWALSQHLPSKDAIKQTETTAAIVTRSIPVAGAPAADQRSVALLDLAVSALGAQPPASDYGPEAIPANTTADPPNAEAAVTPEPSQSEVAAVEADPAAAATPVNDANLTRKIQRELRRVGCLKSAADGVWGSGTERAMRRFSERIDAELPIDGPDAVLLILLEKFDNRACGAPCPEGETPNAKGHCRAVEQTADADTPADANVPTTIATLAGAGSASLSAPQVDAETEPATAASFASSTPELEGAGLAEAQGAKISIVRTPVARVAKAKRVRILHAAQPRRKTRWALPRYYGLGVANVRPARVVSGPRKRKRRVGAAAAYRRWMRRSAITMR